MPLSEYEQRVLEELEQQLRSDDPKLANTISGRPVRRPVFVGLGILGLLGGLAALIGGSAIGQLWLSVVGFLLMFSGVLLAVSRPRDRNSKGESGSDRPDNVHPIDGKSGKQAKRSGTDSGFMDKLEERWDRRRREP